MACREICLEGKEASFRSSESGILVGHPHGNESGGGGAGDGESGWFMSRGWHGPGEDVGERRRVQGRSPRIQT